MRSSLEAQGSGEDLATFALRDAQKMSRYAADTSSGAGSPEKIVR
jgi:hypothetical protein